jgi:hypothetical protein
MEQCHPIQPTTAMSLSDELQRLAELRSSGALTESEFQQAKTKLLNEKTPLRREAPDDRQDQSLGRAANRYVTFQLIMTIIVGLVILFVIAPRMCSSSGPSFGPMMPFQR